MGRSLKYKFPALAKFLDNHVEVKGVDDILSLTESSFIKQYAKDSFNDDSRKARAVYREAHRVREMIVLLWANIKDTVSSPFTASALFNNIDIPDSFIKHQLLTPSYNRLFGNLDYRSYDECRTVYGPAAYFVDLMRFVEKHIPQDSLPPLHSLKERRPGLFTLPLTCDHTFTLLPTIDIVNEVLDPVVRTTQSSSELILSRATFPQTLPAVLPLEHIRLYLSQLNLSLSSIYQLYGQSESNINRETLTLSPDDYELLMKQVPSSAHLRDFYGVKDLDDLKNVDVFLEKTGLSRAELNQLIFGDLTDAEIAAGMSRLMFINNTADGEGYLRVEDVQIFLNEAGFDPTTTTASDNHDNLLGLSERKLDRIYRFLKLSRKLGWSFSELDWVIRSLQGVDNTESVLLFDGVNDHVLVDLSSAQAEHGSSLFATDTQEFTLEAWVAPSRAGIHPIVSKGGPDLVTGKTKTHFSWWITPAGKLAFFHYEQEPNTSTKDLSIFASTSNFPFEETAAGDPNEIKGEHAALNVVSERTVPTGTFTHVAVAGNKKNGDTGLYEYSFFINGELDSTWSLNRQISVGGDDAQLNAKLYIGRDLNNSHFAGHITDVRVWQQARIASTIAADRFKRLNGREGNLLAYWPLVESVDNVVHDMRIAASTPSLVEDSRDARPGVLGGVSHYAQPVWTRGALALDVLPRPVSLRYRYEFDGVSQYLGHELDAMAGKGLASLPVTVEAWVSVSDATKRHDLVSFAQTSAQGARSALYSMRLEPSGAGTSGELAVVFELPQRGAETRSSDMYRTYVQAGKLTHVQASMNQAEDKFELLVFVDGEKSGSALFVRDDDADWEQEKLLPAADSYVLYLGRSLADPPAEVHYLQGMMQEVRIWASSKTPDLSRFYQLTGAEQFLVGYWRLDEPRPASQLVENRAYNRTSFDFGKQLSAHSPVLTSYPRVLQPDPVLSDAHVITFYGASTSPLSLRNAKQFGLGQGESFSVQFWFRMHDVSVGAPQLLFGQGESELGLAIYVHDARLHVYAWCAAYDGSAAGRTLDWKHLEWLDRSVTARQWTHVTVTYDETYVGASGASGIELRLHVNGTLAQRKTDCFRLDPIGASCLGGVASGCALRLLASHVLSGGGADPNAPVTEGLSLHGQITDLRLWNIAIPPSKLLDGTRAYHPNVRPTDISDDDENTNSLVCYAPLTANYGHDVSAHEGPRYDVAGAQRVEIPDQGAGGHTGTLHVGPDKLDGKWRDAKLLPVYPDRVLRLSAGDYVYLPDARALELTEERPFTFEFWLAPVASTAVQALLTVPGYMLSVSETELVLTSTAARSGREVARLEIAFDSTWKPVSWHYAAQQHTLTFSDTFSTRGVGGGVQQNGRVVLGSLTAQELRVGPLKIWSGDKLVAHWTFEAEPTESIGDRTAHGLRAALQRGSDGGAWGAPSSSPVPPTFSRAQRALALNNAGGALVDDYPGVTPSYIDLAPALHALGGQGTVELWVEFTASGQLPPDGVLLDASSTQQPRQPFLLAVRGGELVFEVSDGNDAATTTTVALPIHLGEGLRHVVASWDYTHGGQDEKKLHIGLQLARQRASATSVSTAVWQQPCFSAPVVGMNRATRFDEAEAFRGTISQLRVWDSVRACDELMRLQEADLYGDERGLLLCVPLIEDSGTAMQELVSGKTLHLKVFSPMHPEARIVDSDWGVCLDGSGTHIAVDGYTPGSSGRVQLVLKLSALDERQLKDGVLFDASMDSGFGFLDKAFTLYVESNRLVFHVEDAADDDLHAQVKLRDLKKFNENFHELVASWHFADGRGTLSLHIDGAQVARRTKPMSARWPRYQTLYVGQRRGSFYNRNRASLSGVVREVSLWDRPFDMSNAGGLLRRYKLREGSGTQLHGVDQNDVADATIVSGSVLLDPWTVLERTVELDGFSRAAYGLETYIECPTALPANEGTVELFARFKNSSDDSGAPRVLLDASTPHTGFVLRLEAGALVFEVANGVVRHALPDTTAAAEHHIVASYKWSASSQCLELGLSVDDFSSAASAEFRLSERVEPQNAYIGLARLEQLSLAAYKPYDGGVSQLRVWRAAYDMRALRQLRYATLDATYEDLHLYMPIRAHSGARLLDVMSGRDAVLRLGVYVGATWVDVPARLLRFDGASAAYVAPTVWSKLLGAAEDDWSIELQFYAESGDAPLLGTVARKLDADPRETLALKLVRGVLRVDVLDQQLVLDDLPADALEPRKWHRVMVQFEGARRRVSVVVDGVRSTNTLELAAGATLAVDRHMWIGATRARNAATQVWEDQHLEGYVSEVRLWSRLLSDDDELSGALRRLKGNETGLFANWVFTDATQCTLVGQDQQRRRAYVFGRNTAPKTVSVRGPGEQPPVPPAQKAPLLDGYNDYLRLRTASSLQAGASYTVEFWYNNGLVDGAWQHVAAVNGGAGVDALYIDGHAVDEPSSSEWLHVLRVLALNLPQADDHPPAVAAGQVAELRIWSGPRSAQQTQSDMHRRVSWRESSLLGRWPLDEGAGPLLREWTEEAPPGVLVPGLERAERKWLQQPPPAVHGAKSALYLDGVDDRVALQQLAALKLDGDFTVEAWVRLDKSAKGTQPLIGTSATLGADEQVLFGFEDGRPTVTLGPATRTFAQQSALADGAWHHVAWVHALSADPAQPSTFSVVVDKKTYSVADKSGSHAMAPAGAYARALAREVSLGAHRWDGEGALYLHGALGRVRVWNFARSAKQLNCYATRPLPGERSVYDTLVASWVFDDRVDVVLSAELYDSENRYHLYWQGDAARKAPEWVSIADHPLLRHPLPQRALMFDGGKQWAVSERALALPPSSWTIECWVRVDDLSSARPVVYFTDGVNDVQLRVAPTGALQLLNGANVALQSGAGFALQPGVFTHVALTYDEQDGAAAVVSLYANRRLVGGSGASVPLGDSVRLEVGRSGRGSGNYFHGLMQQLNIWLGVQADGSELRTANIYTPIEAAANLYAAWSLSGTTHGEVGNAVSGGTPLVLGGTIDLLVPSAGAPVATDQIESVRDLIDARRTVLNLPPPESDTTPLLRVPNVRAATHADRARRFVEVWFYVHNPALAARQTIYAEHNDNGAQELRIFVENGELVYEGVFLVSDPALPFCVDEDENNGVETPTTTTPLPRTETHSIRTRRIQPRYWHHAVLVLDGRAERRENALCGALDGRVVGICAGWQLSGQPDSATVGGLRFPLAMGTGTSDVLPASSDVLDGQIAEVRVWEADASGELPPDLSYSARRANTARQALLWKWSTFDQVQPLPATWLSAMREPELEDVGGSKSEMPLADIAAVRMLQSATDSSLFMLSALWTDMRFVGDAKGNLYDRVFNPSTAAEYWAYTDRREWDLDNDENDEMRAIRTRLLSTLRVRSIDDLKRMVAAISGAGTGTVALDGAYLTHLYRITLLASLLGLLIADVLGVINVLRTPPAPVSTTRPKVADDEPNLGGSAGKLLESLIALSRIDTVNLAKQVNKNLVPEPPTVNVVKELSVHDVLTLKTRADWMQTTGIDLAKFSYLVDDVEDVRVGLGYTNEALADGSRTFLENSNAYFVTPASFTSDTLSDASSATVFDFVQGDGSNVISAVQLTKGGAAQPVVVRDPQDASLKQRIRDALHWGVPAPSSTMTNGGTDGEEEKRIVLDTNLFEPLSYSSNRPKKKLTMQQLVDAGFVDSGGFVLKTVDNEPLVQDGQYGVALERLRQLVKSVDPNAFHAADAESNKRGKDVKIDDSKLVVLRDFLAGRYTAQTSIPDDVVEQLDALRQGMKESAESFLIDLLDTDRDTLVAITTRTSGRTFSAPRGIDVSAVLKGAAGVVLASSGELDESVEQFELAANKLRADLKQLNKTVLILTLFDLNDEERNELLARPETFGLVADSLVNPTFEDLYLLKTFVDLKTKVRDENTALLQIVRQTNAGGMNYLPLLAKVCEGASMIETLGTSVPAMRDLASTETLTFEFYDTNAKTLFELMRAKYADDEWSGVYAPLHDRIATRKRDLLLGKLMFDLSDVLDDRKDPNVLYEYLLLDVQTGSEVSTSRIVQAIASVQLYVQRCLMNLEKDVDPAAISADEWEWMKNFRVWQANRKVFLYPENFIEPDLRTFKTPIFDKVVDNLTQGEIDEDSVKNAYNTYFDELADVANLTIIGSYVHTESLVEKHPWYVRFEGERTPVLTYTVNEPAGYWDLFTLALWTRPSFVFGNTTTLVSHRIPDDGTFWHLSAVSTLSDKGEARVMFEFACSTKASPRGTYTWRSSRAYAPAQWYHVAVTYNGSSLALLVQPPNASPHSDSPSTSGNLALSCTGVLQLGANVADGDGVVRDAHAALSDVQIWRKTFNSAQMENVRQAPPLADRVAALVVYLPLDEGAGVPQDAMQRAQTADVAVQWAFANARDGAPRRTQTRKTLYLVGRNEATRKMYWRAWKHETRWLPWQEISTTINGEYVTPVFAFGRLFLFWAELQKTVIGEEREWVKNNAAGFPVDQLNKPIVLRQVGTGDRADHHLDIDKKEYRVPTKAYDPNASLYIRQREGSKRYIIHDDTLAGRAELVNVEHANVTVKFTYQNNSGAWTQPRTFDAIDLRDKEDKALIMSQLKWQKIYAHRWRSNDGASAGSVAQAARDVFALGTPIGETLDEQALELRQIGTLDDIDAREGFTFETWFKFEPGDALVTVPLFEYRSTDVPVGLMLTIPDKSSTDAPLRIAKAALVIERTIDVLIDAQATVDDKLRSDIEEQIAALAESTQNLDLLLQRLGNALQALADMLAPPATNTTSTSASSGGNHLPDTDNAPQPAAALSISSPDRRVRLLWVINYLKKAIDYFEHAATADNDASADPLASADLSALPAAITEQSLLKVARADAWQLAQLAKVVDVNGNGDIELSGVLRLFCADDLRDFGDRISLELGVAGNAVLPLLAKNTKRFAKKFDNVSDRWTYVAGNIVKNEDRSNNFVVLRSSIYTGSPTNPRVEELEVEQFEAIGHNAFRLMHTDNNLMVGVAPQNVVSDEYKVRMALFRLWSRVLPRDELMTNRRNLLPEETAYGRVLELSLANPKSDAAAGTLGLRQTYAATEPKDNDVDRIMLIIGDGIVLSMRNTLRDEGRTYHLSQETSNNEYQLELSQNGTEKPTVNLQPDGDYWAVGYNGVNALFRMDRYAPLSRAVFLDAAPSSREVPSNLAGAVASWSDRTYNSDGQRVLLNQEDKNALKIEESYIVDVMNQPNWYLLDVGDEIFLVQMNPGGKIEQVRTAEERLMVTSRGNSTSFDVTYTSDPAMRSEDEQTVELQFSRINTFAVETLRARLYEGIDHLFAVGTQQTKEPVFKDEFKSAPDVDEKTIAEVNLPSDDIFRGAYKLYYEEVFFHLPLLIAVKLSAAQSFAEAQKWFHYIFNPTVGTTNGSSANDRYWRYIQFRGKSLTSVVELLSDQEALDAYREDPFDPHAIAALRMNTYQKVVVIKYIRNLVDWADNLFSEDTRESINEATQLYVLASTLLGPTPKAKPSKEIDPVGTYEQIRARLRDSLIVPDFVTGRNQTPIDDTKRVIPFDAHSGVLTSFGVPENAEFISLWGTIDDRLFKIRHSLNINGVFRTLALFQPPIDPRALVVAAASGAGGFASALAGGGAVVPHYRLDSTLEKAKEMVGVVIELGGQLNDAIESRDDAALDALEHAHEQAILKMTSDVKELEEAAAEFNHKALEQSLASATQRRDKLDEWTKERVLAEEAGWFAAKGNSIALRLLAGVFGFIASWGAVTPTVEAGAAGFGGSPVLTLKTGGEKVSDGFSKAGDVLELAADVLDITSDILDKSAAIELRHREWIQDRTETENEMKEINQQIAEANAHLQIARRERAIHEQEVRNSVEVGDFMRSRFHNAQLRSWLVNRTSSLYFQAYKIALDMAKQAQRAYQFEFASTSSFISATYWDSSRKGLLAGESLKLDLMRLEKASHDEDSRYMEITKNISLASIDPAAFIQLITTGKCQFSLSHMLFDMDFPGHWFRVIKSVEISIPVDLNNNSDAAKFDGVHAMLTQTGHKTLLGADFDGVEYLYGLQSLNPGSVRVDWRANQQIAISTSTRDSGLFRLKFTDDRYLPFENTGCVSSWTLEIPKDTNRFDLSIIKDVTLHVRYSCNADNGSFKKQVRESAQFQQAIKSGTRLLNLANVFPQWAAELNKPDVSEVAVPLSGVLPGNLKFDAPDSFSVLLIKVATDGDTEEAGGENAVVTDDGAALTLVLSGLDTSARNYLAFVAFEAADLK